MIPNQKAASKDHPKFLNAADGLLAAELAAPPDPARDALQKAASVNLARQHGLTTEEIENILGVTSNGEGYLTGAAAGLTRGENDPA